MIIKKNHLKRALAEFGLVLLALLVLVYLGYHSVSGYSSGIESEAAVYASEEQTLELRGVIFRDETVVRSHSPQNAVYYTRDGEKLAIGEAAAGICAVAPQKESLDRLYYLDHRIDLIERALDMPASVTNYSLLASQISALIAQNYFSDTSVSDFMSASDLLELSIIRASMKDSRSKYVESLAQMKAERDSIIASFGISEPISFNQPLFFYRQCDGGEEIFSLSALESLSAEQLDGLILRYQNATPDKSAIGKTVSDHVWYLAVSATAEEAATLTRSASYDVRFSSGDTVRGRLDRIDGIGEQRLLVFRFTGMPTGFDYSRIQSISICYGQIEGYRVPSSSIRYIDGRTCVYTLYGGQIFLRTADIVARSGEWCYISKSSPPLTLESGEVCEGLKPNDFVVVRGRDLYHLKIVE